MIADEQILLAQRRAIKQVTARARTVNASDDAIPSPCISVCTVNAETGLCQGCFRTLDEIAAWSRLTPDARRGIWQVIAQRMAALQA